MSNDLQVQIDALNNLDDAIVDLKDEYSQE